MQEHVKVYVDYMEKKGILPHEFKCEVCRKGTGINADIHHINGRGENKDVIENLMLLCRICHNKYGQIKKYLDMLIEIHNKFLKK